MKYTSPLLTAGSGLLAGNVFSHNAGGQYIRSHRIPVNRRTPRQEGVRSFLASLSSRWTETLTGAQRDAWTVFADNSPIIDRLGKSIKISGLAQYVGCNVTRLQVGLPEQDDAPVIFTAPTVGPVTVSATAASAALSVSFDNTAPWAHQNDGRLVIAVSIPKGKGINFFNGPYQYAGSVSGNLASPPTSPHVITMPNPAGPAQSKIFVRVRALEEDGRQSGPFQISRTV